MSEFVVHPIGRVESVLTDLVDAPRQGDEVLLVDVKPVLGDIDER